MKLAVLSDTHDNIWNLEKAMPYLRSAAGVIHCGDLCSPFMARVLGEGIPDLPVHIVWGNNEGDTHLIHMVSQSYSNLTLHGPLAELELDGVPVGVNHYPAIARGLAHSGLYRIVCYGHDHKSHEERIHDCLLLNPGELLGMGGRATLALVETGDLSIEWVEL